jgi:lysophospholipase L1-like esterase
MRLHTSLLVGFACVVIAAAPAAATGRETPGSPNLPNSMAGIGDSITRATDVCCSYGDHPDQSWSTGGGIADGIESHYERILAATPSIRGNNYNDARAGAKMRDAEAQAQTAISQRARYVTILMGANDVCTDSPSTMTSASDFRAQFSATMAELAAGLPPNSHVFVSSLPNIYQLWQLFHDNLTAEFVWSVAQICQSMLSIYNTEAARQAVLAHEQALNQVLADVCSQYPTCRFDNNAVFNYPFSTSDVSTLDYFHPSISGQATLASLTWQHSWWSNL